MTETAGRARQIEAQVEAARRMVRNTLRQFLEGRPEEPSTEAISVTARDLERYAIEWGWLVPDDAAERHDLIAALVDRFGASVLTGSNTQQFLHLVETEPQPETESAGDTAVDVLEQSGECIAVRGGETLLRQGEMSADLYIVVTGRLAAAQTTADGGERVLREMVRGTSIGELAALTGQPRAARVFAVRDSHLLRVPRAAFETAVARFPEVLRGVALTLVAREREGQRRTRRPSVRTLALLPIGAQPRISDFAHGLAAALSRYGATRLVGPEEAASKHPGVFQGWLDGLEEAHRFVVYVADATASEWTARCIRQADHIFLVATADMDPRSGGAEQLMGAEVVAPRELVLLQARTPCDTWTWLSHRRVTAHHHLRLHSETDLARLARRVVGRAVGVVLGGGGARAFAHIGALRALVEAGVPIDNVGGVSAGAIIAAQLACGWDVSDLYARNRRLANVGRKLIDYTFPLVSLIQARKFTGLLHELFGQTHIEDLWLPFWCLSSNLTRAEKIVHRRGLLAAALRASCALPGVLPPVLIDGDVVVDGGLIDTVPVATMNEVLDDSGVTVAVDVSAEIDLERQYSFGNSVSGLQLLWEQVNPFARSRLIAPSMPAVLLRSIELASVMHRHEHMQASALFIKLPVAHVDRLAFDQQSFEELVTIGYTHTREVLRTADLSRLGLR